MLRQLWSDVRYRVRALVRRDTAERELHDELRFHLEREAEKYAAMGASPDDAKRRARHAFGSVSSAAEASRDVRGTMLIETTVQDIRYAIRGLRARPGFTLGVVLTLGLGIGANAAMFGVVDRMLFRAPDYLRNADQVHRIYESWTTRNGNRVDEAFSYPRYLDFVKWSHAFSAIAAYSTEMVAVGDGDNALERPVTAATASYFDIFDARPVIGRFFAADDDRTVNPTNVVVLGNTFWQTQFGGRRDVVGTKIRVGHTLCTIIGVAPPRFIGMSDRGSPSLFVPFSTYAMDHNTGDDLTDYARDYRMRWVHTMARRKAGVSVDVATADLSDALRQSWQAQAGADGRSARIEQQKPHAILGRVQAGRGPMATSDAKVVAWIGGVALVVLLIACANVANLLLARAMTRRREIALRLALGVSRSRLLRQLLTESLVLAILGGGVGIAAAQWGGTVIRALFLPPDVGDSVLTDTRTLIVALVATLGAAIATALAPAMQALRGQLTGALNAAERDAGVRPSRARTALLLLQATLSVVLLVGAGLFVRSLQHVREMRLGFDVDPVLVVTDNLRGMPLTQAEHNALEQRIVEASRAIPGVVAATPSLSVPFSMLVGLPIAADGVDTVSQRGTFYLQAGGESFFRTMGTRILRGRGLDASDDVAGAPRVAVVSDGMAKALWPDEDPIGKCLRIGLRAPDCTTVVGVSEEMHTQSLDDPREHVYTLPLSQFGGGPAGSVLVRVGGNAADYAEMIRRRIQGMMPGASYVTVAPLESVVDPRLRSWQVGATMFVAFAMLALVLAGVGLYSVIAYGVTQRRQEIGVRIALGASRAHVVRLVVSSGLRLVCAGVALGVIVAVYASRWIALLLFKESPRDPVVYSIVAGVLVVVAIIASALPAAAAARVDPNVALRAN